MKKYNTFFGYTFKEVIAFIMTVIITTVSKDIISVGFSKIIEYFPNIKAIITITINGYFFWVLIITITAIILTLKRNKRVRNNKQDKEIAKIENDYKNKIKEIEIHYKDNIAKKDKDYNDKIKELNLDYENKISQLKKDYELKLKQYEFYPKTNIDYNYVIKKTQQDLTFYSKTEMKLIRSSYLNKNNCNEFKFKYQWSGSDVEDIKLGDNCVSHYQLNLPKKLNKKHKNKRFKNKNIKFDNSPENHAMSVVSGYPLGGTYTVTPHNGNFSEEEEIHVIFKLKDNNRDMETLLSMNIMRPTQELVFIIRLPKKLKIKNIRAERQLLFGDYKKEMMSKGDYVLDEKNNLDGSKIFTIKVENPQMFYCYVMKWDWN